MRIIKTNEIKNKEIKGIHLGWSLAGPPMMITICYLFNDLMIDTGLSHMQKEVLSLAAEQGITKAYLTHHHEDHSGNAAALQSKLGVQVYGHPLTVDKMSRPNPIHLYQRYVWGKAQHLKMKACAKAPGIKKADTEKIDSKIPDTIDTKLGQMIPIHAPGHSKDHVCYFLKDAGIIFSGDLYLADRIKYFRSDECLGTQIESLKKVLKLDFDMLLCGHFPRITEGKKHVQTKLAFMEELYGSVVNLWKQGLPENQIFNTLKLKEDPLTVSITLGNVSMMNGIRSIIRHFQQSLTD